VSKNSAIEWTDHTFNLAWGCVEAPYGGCDHCYARELSARYGFDVWGPGKERRTFGETYWKQPLKWDEEAAERGVRARVFCSSMTDVFLNDPIIDRERAKLWPLIRSTPNLDWLILTKHPERIALNVPEAFPGAYPNVWLGVSVENLPAAWRVKMLAKLPAVVRFVSAEPLLGPLQALDLTGIDWVIVGGESGAKARPMDLTWVRDLRDQCSLVGAAFFLKQLGVVQAKQSGDRGKGDDIAIFPTDLQIREYPEPRIMSRRLARA